jgi:hypothetical protein
VRTLTGIRSSFVGRVTAVSGWAGWAGWAGSEVAPGCRSARPDRQGRKQRTHAHTMSMTLGAAKCVPPLLAWLRRARTGDQVVVLQFLFEDALHCTRET